MTGWIRLHRSIRDHWVFRDEKKLKWWLIILLETNYQDKKVVIGNQLFECRRGESIKSLRTWAKLFNCTAKTVKYFFSLLEKDDMIETKSIGISTHLKVCNYDTYQGEGNTKETASNTDSNTDKKQELPTNIKYKKEKKLNNSKKFIAPCLEEVIDYFEQSGYSKESAARAFNLYHVGDWKDTNGKQVRNWKQKMIGVWFREEYKINGHNRHLVATVVPTLTTNQGE